MNSLLGLNSKNDEFAENVAFDWKRSLHYEAMWVLVLNAFSIEFDKISKELYHFTFSKRQQVFRNFESSQA